MLWHNTDNWLDLLLLKWTKAFKIISRHRIFRRRPSHCRWKTVHHLRLPKKLPPRKPTSTCGKLQWSIFETLNMEYYYGNQSKSKGVLKAAEIIHRVSLAEIEDNIRFCSLVGGGTICVPNLFSLLPLLIFSSLPLLHCLWSLGFGVVDLWLPFWQPFTTLDSNFGRNKYCIWLMMWENDYPTTRPNQWIQATAAAKKLWISKPR